MFSFIREDLQFHMGETKRDCHTMVSLIACHHAAVSTIEKGVALLLDH